MKQTRSIIENHLESHPEFQYHIDTHFAKISENLESHPDIAIEICKSLIESLAKTIIKKYEGDEYSDERYKDFNFPDLSLRMMKIIKAHTQIQNGFVESLFELMRVLGNHRNETGDISHGRASPKEKVSSIQDALFIMQMTDNLCQYILGVYFSIESWEEEEIVDYYDERFQEFNQILDDQFNQQIEENNPMKGLLYSRALFEQDLPAYMDRYDEFITPQ